MTSIFFIQCIIIQILLDLVFVIYRIIKVPVRVISLSVVSVVVNDIYVSLTIDIHDCFHSWQVNGEDKTDSAIQKNFTSELRFKVVEDAFVNCTADNGFGIDWKSGNISVLSKK